jgi:hypothetical protein
MAGIFDLPDDGTRLLDKEIKGEEEYNASLRAKKNDENNDIFVDGGLGFSDDEAEEGGDTVGELSKPMGFKKNKNDKVKVSLLLRMITLFSCVIVRR